MSSQDALNDGLRDYLASVTQQQSLQAAHEYLAHLYGRLAEDQDLLDADNRVILAGMCDTILQSALDKPDIYEDMHYAHSTMLVWWHNALPDTNSWDQVMPLLECKFDMIHALASTGTRNSLTLATDILSEIREYRAYDLDNTARDDDIQETNDSYVCYATYRLANQIIDSVEQNLTDEDNSDLVADFCTRQDDQYIVYFQEYGEEYHEEHFEEHDIAPEDDSIVRAATLIECCYCALDEFEQEHGGEYAAKLRRRYVDYCLEKGSLGDLCDAMNSLAIPIFATLEKGKIHQRERSEFRETEPLLYRLMQKICSNAINNIHVLKNIADSLGMLTSGSMKGLYHNRSARERLAYYNQVLDRTLLRIDCLENFNPQSDDSMDYDPDSGMDMDYVPS